MVQPAVPRSSFIERLRYRLRIGWYKVCPLPRPRYIAGTPTTGGNDGFDLCFPPIAQTLAEAAMSVEAFAFAHQVLERGQVRPVLAATPTS